MSNRRRMFGQKELEDMGMKLIDTVEITGNVNLYGSGVKTNFFMNYRDTNSTWCIICKNNTAAANNLQYVVGNFLNGVSYTTKMFRQNEVVDASNICNINRGSILELWAMNTDSVYNRYNVG